jgi:hypothetical protein
MTSTIALALSLVVTPPAAQPVPKGFTLILNDSAYVDHVWTDAPATIKPGQTIFYPYAGQVEILVKDATSSSPAGRICLLNRGSITFESMDKYNPVQATLNFGTLDSDIDSSRVHLALKTFACTLTTVGTHFRVERTKYDVTNLDVFSGVVTMTTPVIAGTTRDTTEVRAGECMSYRLSQNYGPLLNYGTESAIYGARHRQGSDHLMRSGH